MLLTLVARARRRLFQNELLTQAANATVAVLAAFILVLLAGTQLLDWYWIVLVAAAAAAVAVYRARKRLLTPYRAAQVVDRRLELSDTLSTALFLQDSAAGVPEQLRQFQLKSADALSQTVDVKGATPYTMPRSVYALTILLLLAGSLFALRFALLGTLNLQAPLAQVFAQQSNDPARKQLARNAHKQSPLSREQDDDPGASPSEQEQQQERTQPDSSNPDGADSSGDPKAGPSDAASKNEGEKDGEMSGNTGSNEDEEAQAEGALNQSGEKSGQDGKQDQKQQAAGKQDANSANQDTSLMNKAKDMFQNLLSSLKPKESPTGDRKNDSAGNQQKGQQKQQDKNGQPQNKPQSGRQSEDQQGEQGEDQQDSKDPNAGKTDSQQSSKQPGSGSGKQDGEKRIKQAEDQAAMGKLTEVLGKRAATVTGEATVEVQSTNQQLKTAYAPGSAQHGQSGGEVNRDEVPVAMQPFVQEYFKQARKPAPPGAAPQKK